MPAHGNLAICYLDQENYSDAIKSFSTAIELAPNASILHLNRSAAYLQLGDIKSAKSDIEEAKSTAQNPQIIARIHFVEARIALDKKDYSNSIALYSKCIELADEKKWLAGLYFQRGSLYLLIEEPEQALHDFNSSIEIDPQNENVHFAKGTANKHLMNWNEAKDDFRESANRSTDISFIIESKGEIASITHYTGYPKKAMEEIKEIQTLDPNNLGTMFRKSEILLTTGDYKEALKIYNSMGDKYKDQAKILHNMGLIYAMQSQHSKALDLYQNALEAFEDNVEVELLRNMAMSYEIVDKLKEAERCLQLAEEKDTSSINAIGARANLEYYNGNYEISKQIHSSGSQTKTFGIGINPFILLPMIALEEFDKATTHLENLAKHDPVPLIYDQAIMHIEKFLSTNDDDRIESVIESLKILRNREIS